MTHIHWVQERASCFLPNVFKDLREVVRQDVNDANQYSPLAAKQCEFTFHDDDPSQFKVMRRHPHPIMPTLTVVFTLNHQTIRVESHGHSFYVTPRWHDDDHRCELTINDEKPVELWQVSRDALDHIVFPSSAE